ncbi:MAG TPA: ATP-binding protein [Vicinamibacteria bacterium]|nr:ATP-binding protein [Vicinamibacteria bacterium]
MDVAIEKKLKRLMLFRVVMVTTLLLVAIYVETVSETLLRVNPLYFLIVATYGLTIAHALALRLTSYRTPLVYGQVVGDLLIITGLVYLTGGTRAGFTLLYPISVLSGSVLLFRRQGLVFAGLATVFYGSLVFAVREGLVPAQGLYEVPFLPAKHLIYSIFVTGVACATVATIGSYFAESLRSAGQRLSEAAEQMADLQEFNKVIVDSIHSGLATANAEGRVLYLNEVGERILGLASGDGEGRTTAELFGAPELEPRRLAGRPARHGLARLEVAYVAPDGRHVDLGVSLTPLATTDPRNAGFLLVFRDLTDVKRLEREVRMKEKLAAVGEMAAYLAHEIRNPLGAISGSAQMLMAEPDVPKDHARLLAIITRESKRLSGTLNQFLFQARPSDRPMEAVDLARVVGEAVTLLRNSPEVSERHSVEFRVEPGPLLCMGDADRIAQVFWNLARNGLEAMPQGGLLHVQLQRSGDDALLLFRDEGRGIDADAQRALFEPFQSDTPRGTGLGLAIVYRIIEEHSGDITFRSILPHGTEVEVRLPLIGVPVAA